MDLAESSLQVLHIMLAGKNVFDLHVKPKRSVGQETRRDPAMRVPH